MLLADPFETAALRAKAKGSCPVWELDDLHTGHWDFETLCSGFGCGECVAGPDDFGLTDPWEPDADPSPGEMPF